MRLRKKRQTKKVMVTTRQEEERVLGDIAAAKLVLSNMGPKDKRWLQKQEVGIEAKSIADIAAIMQGKQGTGSLEK